jgi:hypothetical protein
MEQTTTYLILFKNKDYIRVPLTDTEADGIISCITTYCPVEKINEHIRLGNHRGTINVSEVLSIVPWAQIGNFAKDC